METTPPRTGINNMEYKQKQKEMPLSSTSLLFSYNLSFLQSYIQF